MTIKRRTITLDGNLIRRARNARGIPQVRVANAVKVSVSHVSLIESGYAVTPELAARIADFLEVPLHALVLAAAPAAGEAPVRPSADNDAASPSGAGLEED